jgi:hypothetical protein
MAFPDAQQLKRYAIERFQSFRIVLGPVAPSARTNLRGIGGGSGPQRGKPRPVPPGLFAAASDDLRDVEAQKDWNNRFDSYFGGLCGAVASAWTTWQGAAAMVGVVINGPVATGGQIVGPALAPLIQASAPRNTDFQRSRTDAIAAAVSQAWAAYTATLRIPGLPLYPSFAALPMPVAPPTPSIPAQVRVLGGVLPLIGADAMKRTMMASCSAREEYTEQFFDAMAYALAQGAFYWTDTTLVTNIMGTGPVPTFAPPYVPVGPVVGGVGNMLPGGLR